MNNRLSYLIVSILIIFVVTACKESWDRIYIPAIAGTWKVKAIETDDADNFISGPIEMEWEAPEETMLGGTEDGMKPSEAAVFITVISSRIVANILKDVTIGENYDISATYSDEIHVAPSNIDNRIWKESGTGYARYKEVSGKNKLLIFLDIDKITNGNKETESIINSFPDLKDLITKGIPVTYETSTDQKNIRFWIDLNMAKKLVPFVVSIAPSIKDEDFGGKGSYIKFLLGNIEEVMNVTTKFNLILKMEK